MLFPTDGIGELQWPDCTLSQLEPVANRHQVDRPVTQSIEISLQVTLKLYLRSDPWWSADTPETLTVFTGLAYNIAAIKKNKNNNNKNFGVLQAMLGGDCHPRTTCYLYTPWPIPNGVAR